MFKNIKETQKSVITIDSQNKAATGGIFLFIGPVMRIATVSLAAMSTKFKCISAPKLLREKD